MSYRDIASLRSALDPRGEMSGSTDNEDMRGFSARLLGEGPDDVEIGQSSDDREHRPHSERDDGHPVDERAVSRHGELLWRQRWQSAVSDGRLAAADRRRERRLREAGSGAAVQALSSGNARQAHRVVGEREHLAEVAQLCAERDARHEDLAADGARRRSLSASQLKPPWWAARTRAADTQAGVREALLGAAAPEKTKAHQQRLQRAVRVALKHAGDNHDLIEHNCVLHEARCNGSALGSDGGQERQGMWDQSGRAAGMCELCGLSASSKGQLDCEEKYMGGGAPQGMRGQE